MARPFWRGCLLGLVGATLPTCSSDPDAFACSTDSMCVDGQNRGQCEATGFCSFPDLDCESQQRYGAQAIEGLAGECVPVDEEVAGTGSSTTDSASSTSDPTSDSGMNTTLPVDGSSEGGSSEGGSSGDTDIPPACVTVFEDDFEDGVLDPWWTAYEADTITVQELDGALRMTVPAGAIGYGGVFSVDTDLRGTVVQAELGPIGDMAQEGVELWLSVGSMDCSHEIGIAGDEISAYVYKDQLYADFVDPTQSLLVRFQIAPDEFLSWEYYQDGTWKVLASGYARCELGFAEYGLFAATDGIVNDTVTRDVLNFSVCAQ